MHRDLTALAPHERLTDKSVSCQTKRTPGKHAQAIFLREEKKVLFETLTGTETSGAWLASSGSQQTYFFCFESPVSSRTSWPWIREPLVRRQGSQVSMRVSRGSASWLSSHGRGLGPRDAPQPLAFSPGKEQAAGVWETCLAPGWPQLRSRLPFGPRSQASLQGRTRESGAFGLWPHPRGSSRISS